MAQLGLQGRLDKQVRLVALFLSLVELEEMVAQQESKVIMEQLVMRGKQDWLGQVVQQELAVQEESKAITELPAMLVMVEPMVQAVLVVVAETQEIQERLEMQEMQEPTVMVALPDREETAAAVAKVVQQAVVQQELVELAAATQELVALVELAAAVVVLVVEGKLVALVVPDQQELQEPLDQREVGRTQDKLELGVLMARMELQEPLDQRELVPNQELLLIQDKLDCLEQLARLGLRVVQEQVLPRGNLDLLLSQD
jgi:hypothetical protein